ncbi:MULTISPECIES: hypothetical protein [unclassified Oceanobacillus]|uniref:hypothetical protein n=1 Tax=unclassified Oceanobacillus TaxID=2630292 RepID=UPI00300E47C2
MNLGSYRFKDYLGDVINIRWIAAGVVFYFYSVLLKRDIAVTAVELNKTFNNWDFTLRLLTDMYLIVYFLIPITLFISFKSILKDFDYQILIRLGSYRQWVFNSIKQFWVRSSPLFLLWIFISLFMTIGFPLSGNWSQLSRTNHITNPISDLAHYFTSPVTAFASQITLILIAISLLHVILATIYVITKSKNFILLISIGVFLGCIIGFKLIPEELLFLSPTSYLSITQGINNFNSLTINYIVVGIIGAVLFLFLHFFIDINKKKYIQLIRPYFPRAIYLFLCIIGIISSANITSSSVDTTVWDVWIVSFIGVSAESFSYLSFFTYTIIFFGFIYLIQLFLSNEIGQLGYYKIIRYQSLHKWFWSWMRKLLINIVAFLLLLMGLSLIIAALFDVKANFYTTIFTNPMFEVMYHFFVNGFLQVGFYVLAIFIVSWISKESIHGLILISVFMVLMLPGINTHAIIPVGLNGMSYLLNYSPYYLTSILLLMNLILLCVIHFLFRGSLKI